MIMPQAKWKSWWQATRYHFVPPSIFPVTIGALVSWSANQPFLLWYFFLVLLAVVINHIALNMTDDYFDYKHSVDQLKPGEKNPYTTCSTAFVIDFLYTRSLALVSTSKQVRYRYLTKIYIIH